MPQVKNSMETLKTQNPIDWLKNNAQYFSPEMNGYSGPPIGQYLSTLPLIDRNGKIIDLGCGNGMLLKFLIEFSSKSLECYGVDINEKAIKEAKILLPIFQSNFIVDDVRKVELGKKPYDIIITNPFYAHPNLADYVYKCINGLTDAGKLIFRVHDDVLKKNNIKSILEIELFRKLGLITSRGSGLEIGILDKKIK